jgi:hypothetical protein
VRAKSLLQPLIIRPAYGEGRDTVAQSGLPEGGPAGKGLPLNSGIPGNKLHEKPSDAGTREFDEGKNKSIYRIDNADDLLSEGDGPIPVREDNADKHDGVGYTGHGDPDPNSPKTKYPYRDGHPHTMNASAHMVAERWLAEQSPVRRVRAGVRVKVALTRDSILSGLNPKVLDKAKKCQASLKRADIGNLRWILAVDCGNGPKVVKMRGSRGQGAITKLSKMDLDMSCSCNAWRWLGSEHHAQREEYLNGEPRGTASVPVIKDPQGINRVCKHVATVLDFVKAWDVGKKR